MQPIATADTPNVPVAGGVHANSFQLDQRRGQGVSLEPYVDADAVANFLSMKRPDVLKLTRAGTIRGYPYCGRVRHVYRYRLSEVAADFAKLQQPAGSTIGRAAPVSQRRRSNG